MLCKNGRCANSAPNTAIQHQPQTPSRQPVTEQEKFYPRTDPLLRFPEGILRHRYTCQVSKDSPQGGVCQEQELHSDNRLSQPSSVRLPVRAELVRSSRPPSL